MKRVVILNVESSRIHGFTNRGVRIYAKDIATDEDIVVAMVKRPTVNQVALVTDRVLKLFGSPNDLSTWNDVIEFLGRCRHGSDDEAEHLVSTRAFIVGSLGEFSQAIKLEGSFVKWTNVNPLRAVSRLPQDSNHVHPEEDQAEAIHPSC